MEDGRFLLPVAIGIAIAAGANIIDHWDDFKRGSGQGLGELIGRRKQPQIPMTMNTITESDLLGNQRREFRQKMPDMSSGRTASWICAIGGLQCGTPSMFAEKLAAVIYL